MIGTPEMLKPEVRAEKKAAKEWRVDTEKHKANPEQLSPGQEFAKTFSSLTRRKDGTPPPRIVRRGIELLAGHSALQPEKKILEGYEYNDPADPTKKTKIPVQGITSNDLPRISYNTDAEINHELAALPFLAAEAKAKSVPFDIAVERQRIIDRRPEAYQRNAKEYLKGLKGNRKSNPVGLRKRAVIRNQVLAHELDANHVMDIQPPDLKTATTAEIAAYEDAKTFLKIAKEQLTEDRRNELIEKYKKRRGTALAFLINMVLQSTGLVTDSAQSELQTQRTH